MRQNAQLSALFVALLSVTLGLKLWVADFTNAADRSRLGQDIIALFARDGYAVTTRASRVAGPIYVARKGRCQIEARDATDAQGMEGAIARDARGLGLLSYIWQGRSYDRLPMIGVQIAEWKQRTLSRLGFDTPLPPIISLVVPANCSFDAARLANLKRYYRGS